MPGIGTNIYGATRWISVGGLTYQPSELAEARAGAVGRGPAGAQAAGGWASGSTCWCRCCRSPGWSPLLIMLEPDLGTTLVVMLVVMSLLFVVGAPLRVFGGLRRRPWWGSRR